MPEKSTLFALLFLQQKLSSVTFKRGVTLGTNGMDRLSQLENQLARLQAERARLLSEGWFLQGCWLVRVKPGGTAKTDRYYWQVRSRQAMFDGKKLKHLKVSEVEEYKAAIERGRQLKQIDRQINLLEQQLQQLSNANKPANQIKNFSRNNGLSSRPLDAISLESELEQQWQGLKETTPTESPCQTPEYQHYYDLFQLAPIPYLVTDAKGVILEANQAVSQLLNVPQPFLVNKPLAVFVASEDLSDFYYKLSQLAQSNSTQVWQINICPRKSEPFVAELSVAIARNIHEQIVSLRIGMYNLSQAQQTIAQVAVERVQQQMQQRHRK